MFGLLGLTESLPRAPGSVSTGVLFGMASLAFLSSFVLFPAWPVSAILFISSKGRMNSVCSWDIPWNHAVGEHLPFYLSRLAIREFVLFVYFSFVK